MEDKAVEQRGCQDHVLGLAIKGGKIREYHCSVKLRLSGVVGNTSD